MDVSVIIPVFNKLGYLDRVLNSVLTQSGVAAKEIIFVDDGSTDGSSQHLTVLAKTNPRVAVIHQENRGVSAARNTGINAAKSEFLAFLDADDEWRPDFLGEIAALRDCMRDCDVFGTSYAVVSGAGEIDSPHRDMQAERFSRIDRFYRALAIGSSPFCSSSICVTRKAIVAIGGFPEDLAYGEDVVTWARLALGYRMAWSSRECVNVYMGTANSSHMSWSPGRAAKMLDAFAKLHANPLLIGKGNSAGEFVAQDMRLAMIRRREIVYRDAVLAGYFGAALRHLSWLAAHQLPIRFLKNSIRLPVAAGKAFLQSRRGWARARDHR